MAKKGYKVIVPGKSPAKTIRSIMTMIQTAITSTKKMKKTIEIVPMSIKDFDTSVDVSDVIGVGRALGKAGAKGAIYEGATMSSKKKEAYQSALDQKKEIDNFCKALNTYKDELNSVIGLLDEKIKNVKLDLSNAGKTLDDWDNKDSKITKKDIGKIVDKVKNKTVKTMANEKKSNSFPILPIFSLLNKEYMKKLVNSAMSNAPKTWKDIKVKKKNKKGKSNNSSDSKDNNSNNKQSSNQGGAAVSGGVGFSGTAGSAATSNTGAKKVKKEKFKTVFESQVKNEKNKKSSKADIGLMGLAVAMRNKSKDGINAEIAGLKQKGYSDAKIKKLVKNAAGNAGVDVEFNDNGKVKTISSQGSAKTNLQKSANESIAKESSNFQSKADSINSNANEELAKLDNSRVEKIQAADNDAINKINAISQNDADGLEKIENIKAERQNTIDAINAQYESEKTTINETRLNRLESNRNEFNSSISDIAKQTQLSAQKAGIKDIKLKGASLNSNANSTSDLANANSSAKINVSNQNFDDAVQMKTEQLNSYESSNEAVGTATEVVETTPTQPSVTEQNPTNVANVVSSDSGSSNNNQAYTAPANNNFSASAPRSQSMDVTNTVDNSSSPVTDTPTDAPTTAPEVPADNPSPIEEEIGDTSDIIDDDASNTVITSSSSSGKSSKSSGSSVIPAVLGVGAAGAAAVAGVRYVKNRKQNEDYDENYDDENNDSSGTGSTSSYMSDDYLGPAGSEYTDSTDYEAVSADDIKPDENNFVDADVLKDEDDFSEDAVMNELN